MTKYQQRGFTLIEIAVVLVIVGLLVGSFIGTFSSRIDTTRRDETKKELDDIKQVLLAYAYTKAPLLYLPCPDVTVPPDGLGDVGAGGFCTSTVGTLPWLDLGLGSEDSWANRYSYWVDANFSNNLNSFDLTTTAAVNGLIFTRVNNAPAQMASNGVAVIFSRGKNGLGGISIDGIARPAIPALGNGHDDEIENDDLNATYMSRFNTDEGVAAAGGAFDDILVWLTDYEIKAKMVEAGVLP